MKPFVKTAVFPTMKKYKTRAILLLDMARNSKIPSDSSFESGSRRLEPRDSSLSMTYKTLALSFGSSEKMKSFAGTVPFSVS